MKTSEAYTDLGPPARRYRPGAWKRMQERRGGPAVAVFPPEPFGWRDWLARDYPGCTYGIGSPDENVPWSKIPTHVRDFVRQHYRPTS